MTLYGFKMWAIGQKVKITPTTGWHIVDVIPIANAL